MPTQSPELVRPGVSRASSAKHRRPLGRCSFLRRGLDECFLSMWAVPATSSAVGPAVSEWLAHRVRYKMSMGWPHDRGGRPLVPR